MVGTAVTRVHLAEAVYQEIGLSRNEAAKIVDTLLDEIVTGLVQEGLVKLSSFGTFEVRRKNKRVGRNPKTGQEVPIEARRAIVFRASHILKESINSALSGREASGNDDAEDSDA